MKRIIKLIGITSFWTVMVLGVIIRTIADSVGKVDYSVPLTVTATQNFCYIKIPDGAVTESEWKTDNISVLNLWLKTHPNKRIVSCVSMSKYRGNITGYTLGFVEGDNSKQKFECINLGNVQSDTYRVRCLQNWKDSHPNNQLVAMTIAPYDTRRVQELVICYE